LLFPSEKRCREIPIIKAIRADKRKGRDLSLWKIAIIEQINKAPESINRFLLNSLNTTGKFINRFITRMGHLIINQLH
jgi:hypothetical protein